MKVIQFTIPVSKDDIITVQEDILPHFYKHLHRHKEAQISWIIKGTGSLIAGNYMQSFKEGDIYFIGANQPHLFKSDALYFDKQSGLQAHALTFFFNPAGLFQPFLSLIEMKSVNKFLQQTGFGLQLPANKKSKIIAQFIAIKKSKNALRIANFIKMLQMMSDIRDWKKLSGITSQEILSDVEGLRMNDVYQFTMSNFSTDITLNQVSAIAHMTPHGFCRYFKKHTRKTYCNFLNEIRIRESCKLLLTGNNVTIAAIASQVGFNSAVSFNRVFKKVKGVSPRHFLKNVHRNNR